MKKLYSFLLLPTFFLLLTGCPFYGYKYDYGIFPADPVNFSAVNSIYDDYNSTSPVIESERYLYFSSNRNSIGNEFDIVGDNFHVLWDKDKGSLTVDDDPHNWRNYDYTDTLFSLMNTGYNEYGPYSLPYYHYNNFNSDSYTDLVIFSNDESGNQDLKFVSFTGYGEYPHLDNGVYGGPEPISSLNSAFNDAYLAFYGPGFISNDYTVEQSRITELLFCSDREGDYDIYQAAVLPDSTILHFLLKDSVGLIIPLDILNSEHQDKCPFADGELLVFTSDRPGGFGGFDLYFSRRNGTIWSEPLNFGDGINTEYDEYRPIVVSYNEFENDLLLFSSNRPDGKGGYDLYYAGISKMIK
ncbi:MAG: hypothetical protein WC599_11885 [Bacteroidales bacterium]